MKLFKSMAVISAAVLVLSSPVEVQAVPVPKAAPPKRARSVSPAPRNTAAASAASAARPISRRGRATVRQLKAQRDEASARAESAGAKRRDLKAQLVAISEMGKVQNTPENRAAHQALRADYNRAKAEHNEALAAKEVAIARYDNMKQKQAEALRGAALLSPQPSAPPLEPGPQLRREPAQRFNPIASAPPMESPRPPIRRVPGVKQDLAGPIAQNRAGPPAQVPYGGIGTGFRTDSFRREQAARQNRDAPLSSAQNGTASGIHTRPAAAPGATYAGPPSFQAAQNPANASGASQGAQPSGN